MKQPDSADKLIGQIKHHEGIRLAVYDDATGDPVVQGYTLKGHPTIGVGRLLTEGRGITEAEVNFLLMNDINDVMSEAAQFDWYAGLNSARKAVVISMIFNMGLPRFSKFEKTIAHIAAGDYTKAADEMLDSRWAEQVGSRANELSKQMATGEWQGV